MTSKRSKLKMNEIRDCQREREEILTNLIGMHEGAVDFFNI